MLQSEITYVYELKSFFSTGQHIVLLIFCGTIE